MSGQRSTPEIQLCTLLQSLPDAVFIVDGAGALLEANKPAERFLGGSRDHLVSKKLQELRKVVSIREGERPADVAALPVNRALQGETVRNQFQVFEWNSGGEDNRAEALVSASPLRDSQGKILGAVVVIRDITEIKELQRRLESSNRDQTVGQMTAGLVHDFNNVVDTLDRAIVVMEMQDQATSEERHTYFAMMHRALRRASELIGRLRQLVHRGPNGIEALETCTLVEDTVEMLRPMLQTSYSSVRLGTDLSPAGRVRGNAADLRRVFTNLIINALHAMPKGGDLKIRCERLAASKTSLSEGFARITISDTGVGIPLDLQKRIFRPYFTTKPSGTGLGLSEAQRIVRSYGGQIHFVSEPGKGTRFAVDLPLADGVSTSEPEPISGPEKPGQREDSSPSRRAVHNQRRLEIG
jgi:two-component system cell cycle sensor histidine kinase/response regulator CckA